MYLKKQLWFYALAVGFIIAQSTLLRLYWFWVRPNLLVILVVVFSYYFSFQRWRVLLFCLFCGLLKDLISITPTGTYLFIYVCLGMLLSEVSRQFYRSNWIVIFPLFVLASFVESIAYLVIRSFLLEKTSSVFPVLWRICVPECLLGLLILLVFAKPFRKHIAVKLT